MLVCVFVVVAATAVFVVVCTFLFIVVYLLLFFVVVVLLLLLVLVKTFMCILISIPFVMDQVAFYYKTRARARARTRARSLSCAQNFQTHPRRLCFAGVVALRFNRHIVK